jgi:ATP-dependent protease ClpP protease subunit
MNNNNNKRKNNNFINTYVPILSNKYKLYDSYNNLLNCDKVVIMDNHVCFDALINKENICALINFINIIIANKHLFSDFKIYIHINCKGGSFTELSNFINFKKTCAYEIVSIIDKECYDSGFILASLCNYRIINKNAKVYMSKFLISAKGDYYWNYFNQCTNEQIIDYKILFYSILCDVVESNITREKLDSYLQKNMIIVWDCKKYKKLGFADEII